MPDAPGRFFFVFLPPPLPLCPRLIACHPASRCLCPFLACRTLSFPVRGGGWHAAGGRGGAAGHPHLDGRHRPPLPCEGGREWLLCVFRFDSFAPFPLPPLPPLPYPPSDSLALVCAAPAAVLPPLRAVRVPPSPTAAPCLRWRWPWGGRGCRTGHGQAPVTCRGRRTAGGPAGRCRCWFFHPPRPPRPPLRGRLFGTVCRCSVSVPPPLTCVAWP